jgi:hypothetical protein
MTTQRQRSDDFERFILAPLSPVFVFVLIFIVMPAVVHGLIWIVEKVG